MEPQHVADLALASVKPYKPEELQFCMQLFSPRTRSYVLQAHSQAAITVRVRKEGRGVGEARCVTPRQRVRVPAWIGPQSWIDTIRSVSETMLVGGGTVSSRWWLSL